MSGFDLDCAMSFSFPSFNQANDKHPRNIVWINVFRKDRCQLHVSSETCVDSGQDLSPLWWRPWCLPWSRRWSSSLSFWSPHFQTTCPFPRVGPQAAQLEAAVSQASIAGFSRKKDAFPLFPEPMATSSLRSLWGGSAFRPPWPPLATHRAQLPGERLWEQLARVRAPRSDPTPGGASAGRAAPQLLDLSRQRPEQEVLHTVHRKWRFRFFLLTSWNSLDELQLSSRSMFWGWAS